MACCLLMFSGDPVDEDPRNLRHNTFQYSMMDTLCTPMCAFAYICPVLAVFNIRRKALNYDMSKYICCMGYFNNGCCQAGNCYETKYPNTCLFFEACCCLGPSMSATRLYVMDIYDLQPDPCDNRIIRFSNCMQCFNCLCSIASIFIREFRHATHLIHVISDTVFYTTLGLMVSQVDHELSYRMPTKQQYEAIPIVEDHMIVKGVPVKGPDY